MHVCTYVWMLVCFVCSFMLSLKPLCSAIWALVFDALRNGVSGVAFRLQGLLTALTLQPDVWRRVVGRGHLLNTSDT